MQNSTFSRRTFLSAGRASLAGLALNHLPFIAHLHVREAVMYRLLRVTISLALAAVAILSTGRASMAVQTPPGDGSFTVDSPAGGLCSFPIRLSAAGGAMLIVLPGDRLTFTSPSLSATLMNLDDPSKQVTLSATAPFHVTIGEDGNLEWVSTGRSLIFDPTIGFVLAIGYFTFTTDPSGVTFIQPLQGKGQLVDVCALIT